MYVYEVEPTFFFEVSSSCYLEVKLVDIVDFRNADTFMLLG